MRMLKYAARFQRFWYVAYASEARNARTFASETVRVSIERTAATAAAWLRMNLSGSPGPYSPGRAVCTASSTHLSTQLPRMQNLLGSISADVSIPPVSSSSSSHDPSAASTHDFSRFGNVVSALADLVTNSTAGWTRTRAMASSASETRPIATCARRQCSTLLLSRAPAGALSASSSTDATASANDSSHASIRGAMDRTNGSFFPFAWRNRSRPISEETRSRSCARSFATDLPSTPPSAIAAAEDEEALVAKVGSSASNPSSSSDTTYPSGMESSSESESTHSATPMALSTAASGFVASFPAGPAPTSWRSLSTLATTLWVSIMSSSVARSSARRFFSLSAFSMSSSSFCMLSRCTVSCAMSLSSGPSHSFVRVSMSGRSSLSARNLSKFWAVMSTSLPSTSLPYASSCTFSSSMVCPRWYMLSTHSSTSKPSDWNGVRSNQSGNTCVSTFTSGAFRSIWRTDMSSSRGISLRSMPSRRSTSSGCSGFGGPSGSPGGGNKASMPQPRASC